VEFPAFLDERQQPLLRLAIALCGSRAPAEDVLQNVLVRAYQQWPRIGVMESPYGYVRTMLVNEHLAWRRHSARQMPAAEVDPGSHPDHSQRIADRDDLLRRVDALPGRQRAAVVLRYFADLDDAEIAATLGCAPVTVRSYVSRGLAALRIQLYAEADRSVVRPIGTEA
jgi:RNA polymerase sigma-70 factor (sigma-E family)